MKTCRLFHKIDGEPVLLSEVKLSMLPPIGSMIYVRAIGLNSHLIPKVVGARIDAIVVSCQLVSVHSLKFNDDTCLLKHNAEEGHYQAFECFEDYELHVSFPEKT